MSLVHILINNNILNMMLTKLIRISTRSQHNNTRLLQYSQRQFGWKPSQHNFFNGETRSFSSPLPKKNIQIDDKKENKKTPKIKLDKDLFQENEKYLNTEPLADAKAPYEYKEKKLKQKKDATKIQKAMNFLHFYLESLAQYFGDILNARFDAV